MDLVPDPPGASHERDQLKQLERAIAVLESFDGEHPAMTLTEVARRTGTTPAAARRILITLRALGHLKSDGRKFSLTPKVLDLGWNYFGSLGLDEIARPVIAETVKRINRPCSLATLDLPFVVYVTRVHPQRVMTIGGGLTTRLTAAATAAGRVLLAALDDAALDQFLDDHPLERYTPRTITDPDEFRAQLQAVRQQGYCLVDQELEIGLRAVSVPVTGRDRRIGAALSASSPADCATLADIRRECLTPLRRAAETLSPALTRPDAHGVIV
jgi:IclR family transcriptional regulator, pca regulon regulatory protein